MPHLGARKMYRYICGCPEASRKEDERLTCPLHHVIFRRKCDHSSGTKHFVFNTEIDCIDCLGKSTLDNILEGSAEIEQAESQVVQYAEELCKRGKGGTQGDVSASSASHDDMVMQHDQWTQELERLMAAWPDRKAELMSKYNDYYGAWHKKYWEDKKWKDEASKPDPGLPSVAWFVGDGDRDFFFKRKAHETVYSAEEVMVLRRITGRTFIK